MTRQREEREVARGLKIAGEIWQRLTEALEDRGGGETDLVDIVRRIPGGADWMARAILERLGIYQVQNLKRGILEQLIEETGIAIDNSLPRDRDGRLMIVSGLLVRIPGAVTFEIPLLCETYDGHGDPTVSRERLLRYWKLSRDTRPATIEEVLGLLYEDPNQDFPIWKDRILIFGSRCYAEGATDVSFQLTSVSPKGHSLSSLYGSETLYLNKPGVRVAFVREENVGEKDADEERDVGDKK